MLQSSFRVTGEIHIRVWDENTNLRLERKTSNLVVATGRDHIANQLGLTPAPDPKMAAIALGANPTPAAVAQANVDLLGDEYFRQALDATYPTSAGNQTSYRISIVPGAATNTDVSSVGIFNDVAPLSGTMLARGVVTPFPILVGDSLTVDWVLSIDAP